MALHQLGVVDYLRQPKAGYYALQRAYQPILPSIEPVTASWRQGSPATVRLWAINDTWTACEDCRLTWQVRQNGQILLREKPRGPCRPTLARWSGS
jgi:beta-mannosidase